MNIVLSLVNDHVKIFFKGDKGLILVREQSTFPSAKKRKSKKKKKSVSQNSDF